MPSVLWHCWLGGRKGIRVKKTEWWDAGMVMCLGQGADLHKWPSWCHCHSLSLASVNPDWFYLPAFTFLVPAHPGRMDKIQDGHKTVCACVCACVTDWSLQNCSNKYYIVHRRACKSLISNSSETSWHYHCFCSRHDCDSCFSSSIRVSCSASCFSWSLQIYRAK